MPNDARGDRRQRILDVAMEVLGTTPGAGMGEVATAAGVVRRTVYGYFPSRSDLVRALTERAVDAISTVLAESEDAEEDADAAWAAFVARLWPLVRRYRVLVVLRRGEYGKDIHSLLGPVERGLTGLVQRGQDSGTFGRHLPADVLGRVAWSAVFAIADHDLSTETLGVTAPTMTTLLMLGVPQSRAQALLERRV